MLAAGSDETMRQNRAASSPAGRLVCSRSKLTARRSRMTIGRPRRLFLCLVSHSWQMASAIPASPSVASCRSGRARRAGRVRRKASRFPVDRAGRIAVVRLWGACSPDQGTLCGIVHGDGDGFDDVIGATIGRSRAGLPFPGRIAVSGRASCSYRLNGENAH